MHQSTPQPRPPWQIWFSAGITLLLIVLIYLNRSEMIEAFNTTRHANFWWLGLALATTLFSYLMSSLVLQIALRSMGYSLSILRTWGTAIVAIILSQSIPAGGIGSYAFLVSLFRRRGIPTGQATLVTTLEVLSYAVAMIIVFIFSVIYLTFNSLETSPAAYVSVFTLLVIISAAVFLITRRIETLQKLLCGIKNGIAKLLRQSWDDTWVNGLVTELVTGRDLIAARRQTVLQLVGIQLLGLSGHALALLMVLHALGISPNYFGVLASFGIAPITSTLNVLPGGGGTVEAALVGIMRLVGIGIEAVPGAIIFRLLHFWLMIPVAAICYYWLMHERPATPLNGRDSALLDDTDVTEPLPTHNEVVVSRQ